MLYCRFTLVLNGKNYISLCNEICIYRNNSIKSPGSNKKFSASRVDNYSKGWLYEGTRVSSSEPQGISNKMRGNR